MFTFLRETVHITLNKKYTEISSEFIVEAILSNYKQRKTNYVLVHQAERICEHAKYGLEKYGAVINK